MKQYKGRADEVTRDHDRDHDHDHDHGDDDCFCTFALYWAHCKLCNVAAFLREFVKVKTGSWMHNIVTAMCGWPTNGPPPPRANTASSRRSSSRRQAPRPYRPLKIERNEHSPKRYTFPSIAESGKNTKE